MDPGYCAVFKRQVPHPVQDDVISLLFKGTDQRLDVAVTLWSRVRNGRQRHGRNRRTTTMASKAVAKYPDLVMC